MASHSLVQAGEQCDGGAVVSSATRREHHSETTAKLQRHGATHGAVADVKNRV
jgi:hypothetical protein